MVVVLAVESLDAPIVDERRAAPRVATDFYAVELRGPSRYFRLVRNVSRTGLLLENPMADEEVGQVLDLEMPTRGRPSPLKLRAEVVYVTRSGRIGLRLLDSSELLEVMNHRQPETPGNT